MGFICDDRLSYLPDYLPYLPDYPALKSQWRYAKFQWVDAKFPWGDSKSRLGDASSRWGDASPLQFKYCIPVQLIPFPVKPYLHSHKYPAIVFLQVAFPEQTLPTSTHSSISEKLHTKSMLEY